MQATEQAMKLLREQLTTSEESKCLSDYSSLMLEVQNMKAEMNQAIDYNSPVFKSKKKRLKIIESAAHSFYESYFNMCKYKQMYVDTKQDLLLKQLELLDFIDLKDSTS